MTAALKPIHRLEKEAAKNNEVAREAFAANMDAYKLQKQVKDALAKGRAQGEDAGGEGRRRRLRGPRSWQAT